MKRFIRLSLMALTLCSGFTLQNDYAYSMMYDNSPANYDQLNLQFARECLEEEVVRHPSFFNEQGFVQKIEATAELLSKMTKIDYDKAQQIVLNYCLHVLCFQIPYCNQRHIIERIQKLIVSGADVNSFYNPIDKSDPQHTLQPTALEQNARGINQTPLMLAVKAMNIPVITCLKEQGADLTMQDNEGNTALIFAVKNKSAQSFNMVRALENTPLLSISQTLNLAAEDWEKCPIDILEYCIKPFLENSINIHNENGYTALMYAAKNNDYASVNYLIDNEAKTTLKNNDNQTAFELAPVNSPTKELLRKHAH